MLKIAVIGVGYLGQYHAEKYSQIKDVELFAVVDINEERAKEIASRFKCKYFLDYREVCKYVDAISVVVPTSLHYEVGRYFLEHGKHCLIEKPITRTVEEANELIEIARKKDLILQVGHVERFNPAIEYLFKHSRQPLFIEAHRISYFKERGIDVDVILDLMIHDIDIALSLVRSPVVEIRASGAPVVTHNIDIANARLTFENGCSANLTASRISFDVMRRFRVFEPQLYISADCLKKENLVVRVDMDDIFQSYYRLPFEEIQPEIIKHDDSDLLVKEIQSFVNAVLGRNHVVVSGEAGRDALKVAMEIAKQIMESLDKFHRGYRGD